MKKILAIVLVCCCAVCFLACGKPAAKTDVSIPHSDNIQKSDPQSTTDQSESDRNRGIEIKIDGEDLEGFFGRSMRRSSMSGVCRHFDLDGDYSVEYIHHPSELPQDDTLDYKLQLNIDNTFVLDVISDGIHTNHYGHWYARRDNITLFYDEPIDPTAHNIYVSDSLYGEILHNGKIMIYDNCNTIVLAKQQQDQTTYQS